MTDHFMDSRIKPWCSTWKSQHIQSRKDFIHLPDLPGLYALVVRDLPRKRVRWLYVGESLNIQQRWMGKHEIEGVMKVLLEVQLPVYIFYWTLPYSNGSEQLKKSLRELESNVIKALKPCLNKTLGQSLDSNFPQRLLQILNSTKEGTDQN